MSGAAGIDRARQARELFRAEQSGTLSSHSAKLTGYPYGSALPHVTDHHGRPVVLISHLAEHTRNVEADGRVSFLVSGSGPDLQASPRAALVGDARPVDAEPTLQARYLRFFPEHAQYLEIGGFRFWTIEPVQVRLIEGFGSLHWITGQTFLANPGQMPAIETSVVEHMNQDHHSALVAYCRQFHNLQAQQVEMIGIDCDGFDVRADDRLVRFRFEQPVTTAARARAALVALAREAGG
jgi:putative heme iron utilization protein